MDAVECINRRKSIRSFKPEPVPREVLMEVIATAQRSPSYKNSQPWNVVVLSGARKEALSAKLVELFDKGVPPSPDLPVPRAWPEAEQARIDQLYRVRAEATGVDMASPEMIVKAKKANFNFYRAPHVVYLFQDASLTPWSLFDLGLFAQSFMLAACARGIGSVPQAFATDYAGEIKSYLDIPETNRLVLGLSTGYPDLESPVNQLRTSRSPVDEIVRWIQ